MKFQLLNIYEIPASDHMVLRNKEGGIKLKKHNLAFKIFCKRIYDYNLILLHRSFPVCHPIATSKRNYLPDLTHIHVCIQLLVISLNGENFMGLMMRAPFCKALLAIVYCNLRTLPKLLCPDVISPES